MAHSHSDARVSSIVATGSTPRYSGSMVHLEVSYDAGSNSFVIGWSGATSARPPSGLVRVLAAASIAGLRSGEENHSPSESNSPMVGI